MQKLKYSLWITILLSSCFSSFSYGSLLVVQKNKNGFSPLTQQNSRKCKQCIFSQFLKYQWPMCVSQVLTEQEKQDLLASNQLYGEERFLQTKLQQECNLDKKATIDLLFIPTALYELFCLTQFFKDFEDSDRDKTPLSQAASQFLWDGRALREPLDLTDVLNEDVTDPVKVQKKIDDLYNIENKRFFNGISGKNESASSYVNEKFTVMLFDLYPELAQCQESLEASKIIQEKSEDLSQKLIQELVFLKEKMDIFHRGDFNQPMQKFVDTLDDEKYYPILKKVIALEYQAREQNRALLLRGTKCLDIPADFENNALKNKFLGASIYTDQVRDILDKDGQWVRYEDISLLQAYREKIVKPYSISFGASLFAGFIADYGGCAYYYLTAKRQYRDDFESHDVIAGYALLVDKKAYYEDRNNHLLFIPPLAPIVTLMSSGEYFHPRITATTITKDKPQSMFGLFNRRIKDTAGVILVEENPLVHAARVSEFIGRYGEIIHTKDAKDLLPEEKAFEDNVLEAQVAVAQQYKKMRLSVIFCMEKCSAIFIDPKKMYTTSDTKIDFQEIAKRFLISK